MSIQIDHISIKGSVPSKYLERKVRFRIVAPAGFLEHSRTFPVLLMNDGQDYHSMHLEDTLMKSFASTGQSKFIYVGLETGTMRMQEYGTASAADFKGRGAKASKYTKFVIEELLPLLKTEFKASLRKEEWVFCGMSMGGLSAFDIGFNHAHSFGKIGVFSGSFWWRKKAYKKGDIPDRSRIVLDMVKKGTHAPHLDFWFQCGTLDETSDRNNNGIIDSIDDTLDLVKELQLEGYTFPGDITYVQVEGGKHDLPTWGRVFPQFLEWAFGIKK